MSQSGQQGVDQASSFFCHQCASYGRPRSWGDGDITGACWNTKLSELSVPPGVVMLIGTVPARCIGVIASTSESLTTVNLVAGEAPNVIFVVPASLVPVRVTSTPPAVIPETGKTAVGAGASI